MAGRLWKRLSPLYLIFPVVLAAALALGLQSYRHVSQIGDKSEASLIESNRTLGARTVEGIENYIIDSDRSLFDLVDLKHLGDFARFWSYILRLSPVVEAAVVLDENLTIVPGGYVSRKKAKDAELFRGLFLKRILPDLPLSGLQTDQPRHQNKQYDGRDYLISFIKRDLEGKTFYVVLKINLDHLVNVVFPDELARLKGKVLLCIRDGQGRVIYGTPVGKAGKFLYEQSFDSTVRSWLLQMAPPRAEMLAAADRDQQRSEILLITLSLAIILAGISLSAYAISKEQRANQQKDIFISNVSHELKTPLSLIRMFAELTALGKLKSPEKSKEYAEIITREAERLSRLIDNVLDFSRMERGRAAYDFQWGHLNEVVERALDVYRHRVEREGCRLLTKIDAELPATRLDENAMTLLLLNLLENAVKYGRGEIAVYLTRVGSFLRLAVGDQGPGIPHDEQRRIFERFYRTRQARTTNVRGSGIGLSLVKHIVEAHGGRVSVESEPGHGAAFIVDIPLVEAREVA